MLPRLQVQLRYVNFDPPSSAKDMHCMIHLMVAILMLLPAMPWSIQISLFFFYVVLYFGRSLG